MATAVAHDCVCCDIDGEDLAKKCKAVEQPLLAVSEVRVGRDTRLLHEAISRLRLADLDESMPITAPHLLEAINYRGLDTL